MDKTKINRLKNFFFEASMASYASGIEPKEIKMADSTGLPGAKRYYYGKHVSGVGYYEYQDIYFDAGQGRSFGFTILVVEKKCVWTMNYSGKCNREIIGDNKTTDFLKAVLLYSYKNRIFHGGRGPAEFKTNPFKGFEYYNYLERNSEFEGFAGQESIYSSAVSGRFPIFSHAYAGGLV